MKDRDERGLPEKTSVEDAEKTPSIGWGVIE